jgi:hypothetical protein
VHFYHRSARRRHPSDSRTVSRIEFPGAGTGRQRESGGHRRMTATAAYAQVGTMRRCRPTEHDKPWVAGRSAPRLIVELDIVSACKCTGHRAHTLSDRTFFVRQISTRINVQKMPFVSDSYWPRAGAPSIDFIARLPTARAYLQRLLWSSQIEQSSDRTQSEADRQPATRTTPPSPRRPPQRATGSARQAEVQPTPLRAGNPITTPTCPPSGYCSW